MTANGVISGSYNAADHSTAVDGAPSSIPEIPDEPEMWGSSILFGTGFASAGAEADAAYLMSYGAEAKVALQSGCKQSMVMTPRDWFFGPRPAGRKESPPCRGRYHQRSDFGRL